jgi:hypothetical protein
MISGKLITNNDVSLAIRNIPYQADVVYAMYDDTVKDLDQEDFYVCVNTASYHHVFKCLDNNNGANSTVQPNFADIVGSNTHLYQTSDGYRWKYMYSYSSAAALKFASSEYVPLITNTEVRDSAVSGSIDVIKVDDPGKGYHNYITGTFVSGDTNIDGNSLMYRISNSAAKTVNGFYTDCLLYITSGSAIGQSKTITDYITTGNGNFITINNFFNTIPENGTQYEIYPRVQVTGSGNETVNVVARALVNALASNIIYRVEVLDSGAGFISAQTKVMANAAVGVTSNAIVRSILSPPGGHGSNAALELCCRTVAVGMSFANTEGNTVPSANFYRRVGILKDPLFRDVSLDLSDVSGSFLNGETVISPFFSAVKFGISTVSGNSTITTNTGNLVETIPNNSPLILRNDDSSSYQYVTVNNVVNTTCVVLNQNCFFNASNATAFLILSTSNAVVNTQTSISSLHLSNVTPRFIPGRTVLGVNSGAYATINGITRSGVSKDYSTFVNLHKYTGSLTFGVFNQNEYVYQGNSKAFLHSYRLDSGIFTMYTSNQVGAFNVSNTITGNISTAIMSITAKYLPELVYGSCEPLYIENLSPITRQPTQTEAFKVFLNF